MACSSGPVRGSHPSSASLTARRRSHAIRLAMIEGLEDRCLLATSGGTDLWSQSDTFNQFSSHLGGLTVFGFGVTDNSADNPGGANVSAAPKFEGFTLSQSLQIGDEEAGVGLGLNGTLSLKMGFNVGFYVNAGTASLFTTAAFLTMCCPPPAAVRDDDHHRHQCGPRHPFHAVAELSAYVDLVLDFSFVGDFEYGEVSPPVAYSTIPSTSMKISQSRSFLSIVKS